MGARIPEASIYICRLVQNSRSVVCQAASMTCTVDTLEARPVREQSGGGQWACQVAGHAGDLQPSSGRGRLRRREGARRRFDSVRKRVNAGGTSLRMWPTLTWDPTSMRPPTRVNRVIC